MTRMSKLLSLAMRYSILPAVVLCLFTPSGVRVAAQNSSGTSSRTNLYGKVCLTKLGRNKKPDKTKCTYEPNLLVLAEPLECNKRVKVRPLPQRTYPDGSFGFWVDKVGHYCLSAQHTGYAMYGSHQVWVGDKKARTNADPPPIYLTNSGRASKQKATEIVMVLYQIEGSDGERVGPRAQAGSPQAELSLDGRVVDRVDNPVRGASVYVLVASRDSNRLSTLAETRTDVKGFYKLPLKVLNENDEYFLSVTRAGFNHFVARFGQDEMPPPTIVLDETTFTDDSLLERSEATRRHLFSPRVMEALPVPGLRNFDTFALLAPGVAPPPETPNARGPGISPGLGTAGQFAVNGLRPRENNFTVDGSDNNDEDIGTRRQGFVALAPQSIESLNEFQIVTALGDARFGRNIGGRVNALTKSGSPEFHGSVYGFLADSRLNARDFFDQTIGNNPASFSLKRQRDGADVLLDGRPIVSPNPMGGENPFTRTQLGFAVGGPVEKLGAFFFVTLERVKSRASRESHFVVPTVEQRGVFESGGTGFLLGGLSTATPTRPLFPATIPGDAIFSLYPFPNNPLGPFGRNTYTAILPANAKGTRLSAKLDRQFGTHSADKSRPPWSFFNGGDNLTGRYNFSQETSTIPVTGEALFSSLRPSVRTKNIAFYLNRQLTKRVSDVIRFSFGRTKLTFDEVRDPFLSPSTFFPGEPFLLNAPLLINVTAPRPNGTLTDPSYLSASSLQGAALLTLLGYDGVTHAEQIAGPLGQVIIPGFSPLGVDVYNFPQSRANNTFQVADTVTYVSRNNQIFTFGFDVRKTEINSTLDRNFRPLAAFGGLRTSTPSPGFAARLPGGQPLAPRVFSGTTLAAAGVPTGLFQTLAVTPNSTVGIRFTQASFFEQADWRVRDNLNINLGARFNYLTELSTKGNTFERAFDPAELERQGQAAVEDCSRISGDRADCDRVAKAIISSFPADLKTPFARERFDLDVRAGLAWSLNDRTVVRGGIGTYAGEFPGIVIGQSRNAFPDFLPLNFADFPVLLPNSSGNQAFLFNPANPILRQSEPTLTIAPGPLNTLLPNINAISFLTTRLVVGAGQRPFSSNVLGLNLVLPQSELQNPYSLQYAVTLERQFGRNYALSVAYVGTRGIKLLRLSTPSLGLNRSRLLEPLGLTVTTQGVISFPPFGGAFPRFGGDILLPQESVPQAQLALARTSFESSASSTYNSLQVEFRKQYTSRFQFRTALTYSHAIDDASDFFDTAGAFSLPQNSLDRSERASSNFDIRLRSVTHFVRDFRKFGGWQLAGIVTAQTGQPFTVNSAFDINRDGNLTDRLDNTAGLIRGSIAGDRSVQLSLAPGTNPLNLLAADGRDGAVGRNTFRAPSQFSFDLSATKFFNFSERVRLHARMEIFNLFNRTNFGIPVRILESPAFGKSTYTTTPPRTIQFVFKLVF
jgi:hypothetical protein